MLDSAFLSQSDRNSIVGDVVQKVGGAIEGIDDPLKFTAGFGELFTTLFSEYFVIGVCLMNDIDDGILGALVDIADEVIGAFFTGFDLVHVIHGLVDDSTTGTRCGHRDIN